MVQAGKPVKLSTGKSKGWNGSCVTEGRILYSQERLFSLQTAATCQSVQLLVKQQRRLAMRYLRGAVKAVPDNCSAYKP